MYFLVQGEVGVVFIFHKIGAEAETKPLNSPVLRGNAVVYLRGNQKNLPGHKPDLAVFLGKPKNFRAGKYALKFHKEMLVGVGIHDLIGDHGVTGGADTVIDLIHGCAEFKLHILPQIFKKRKLLKIL